MQFMFCRPLRIRLQPHNIKTLRLDYPMEDDMESPHLSNSNKFAHNNFNPQWSHLQ